MKGLTFKYLIAVVCFLCLGVVGRAQMDSTKTLSVGIDYVLPELVLKPDRYVIDHWTESGYRYIQEYKYSSEIGISVNHLINNRLALEYRLSDFIVVSEETVTHYPFLSAPELTSERFYQRHFYNIHLGMQVNFGLKYNPYYSAVVNPGIRAPLAGKIYTTDYENGIPTYSVTRLSSSSNGIFSVEFGVLANFKIGEQFMLRTGLLLMNVPSPIIVSDVWSLRLPISIRMKF